MINGAVEEAESTPSPRPEDFFIHTYKEMTPELDEQLADLRSYLKGGPR
jgi:TPP-dependent pyruvate/acetoin dehydrogenase alpha subunit